MSYPSIGNTFSIDKLEVNWANGSNIFIDYGSQSLGKRITITEGNAKADISSLKPLNLTGTAKHDHHHQKLY